MKEISNENLVEIGRQHRTAMFVWLAFVVLASASAVIVAVFGPSIIAGEKRISGDEQTVTTLWMLILFVAVGTLILRRLFNQWERLKNAALLGGIQGLLKHLRFNSLVLGGLGLVIVVVGFGITLATGSGFDMIRATAIAFVVFLISFPRKKVWKTIVSNLQDI